MTEITTPVQFEDAWPRIDKVTGWLSPGQERCLFDIASGLPGNAKILEIGCYLGRSTASIASACLGTGRRVFCIDTFAGNDSDFRNGVNSISWEGEDFFPVWDRHLQEAGVRHLVTPLRGTSQALASAWVEPVDFLFIDASHQFDDLLHDVRCYGPRVKPGGILALHDVTPGWPDVYRVWHEFTAPTLVDLRSKGSLAYGIVPRT